MEIRFATKDLESLYTEEKGAERYPPEVIDAFFRRVATIANATDERDLRALKSLHFEKLRNEFYSIRLNKQWRLELTFEKCKENGKSVIVIRISNHYGD